MTKVSLLYHNGYWDGPLSGVCQINDQRYYFNCVNDYHDKLDSRIFRVDSLTSDEWKVEDHWHQLFEQHVGTHTNYGEKSGPVKPQASHHLFYDAAKDRPQRNFKNKTPIGYFDLKEKILRATKFRDYFIDGDCFHAFHQRGCQMYDILVWNNKAQFFKYHRPPEDTPPDKIMAAMGDGTYPGWSILHKDGEIDYPLGVKFCLDCGNRLPVDLKEFLKS